MADATADIANPKAKTAGIERVLKHLRTHVKSSVLLLLLVGGVIAWLLTAPRHVDAAAFAELTGDAVKGERVFTAAGCASCHSAPHAEGENKLALVGGRAFPSPFGTFRAPGLAFGEGGQHAEWSMVTFADAVVKGVSPDGQHYYPALPFWSYKNMTETDTADLFAYMKNLPVVEFEDQPHDIGFPFNIRRSLGGWKFLNLGQGWVMEDTGGDAQVERGRYLVEALGHCGECHTERNLIGGLKTGKWLQGAANPSGKGRIPGITPALLSWSEADLLGYFKTGLTPEFDSAGGEMVDVIDNLAKLPEDDLKAIIAYLKAL